MSLARALKALELRLRHQAREEQPALDVGPQRLDAPARVGGRGDRGGGRAPAHHHAHLPLQMLFRAFALRRAAG